jgi:hypothetical protein
MMRNDLRELKVKKQRQKVYNREEWTLIVKKATVLRRR